MRESRQEGREGRWREERRKRDGGMESRSWRGGKEEKN